MISHLNPALHAAAHLVTLRVVESLVEGTLIALFAGFVIRSRNNAGSRFAVWFSSLIAIAAVPVLTGEWLRNSTPMSSVAPEITLPDSWASYLFGIWAFIATWFLLGVARSLWHLRTIRNDCVEVNPATTDPLLRDTLCRHQGRRKITLCTSNLVKVPTALGLLKPAVVIPDWLMKELSAEELNQILLHEIAHLRRWDDWTNLAQQVIKAVFFFHPAVWWIERKVALEREMACDDAVLAETGSPRLYAECLTRLAEKSFVQRSTVLAQAALGRIRQISVRVRRILDPQCSFVQTRSLKPALSLIALFAVTCGVWSARASRLIGFEDGSQVPVAAMPSPHYSQASVPDFKVKSIPALARQIPVAARAVLKRPPKSVKRAIYSAKAQARPVPPVHQAIQLVQSAKVTMTTVPVTETLFVVIEDRSSDSVGVSGYQIQMWRLTVFQTIVNSSNSTSSRKQI